MKENLQNRYDFSEIISALEKSEYPLIVGHLSPDEDAAGSALALSMALKQLGKEPMVVFEDDLPSYLDFLPQQSTILKPEAIDEKRDLMVMVDCASPKRIGKEWSLPLVDKLPVIAIDHHATTDGFECTNLTDSKAAANSQIIYYLLNALCCEITLDIATCLFAGISGDTGGFRYSNTNRETMEIGGMLMDMGVDTQLIRTRLFESRPMKDLSMMGVAMLNMHQSADKLLVWTSVSLAEKAKYNATEINCENISSYTMFPEGVKVGVFFQEMPEGIIKMSMRSRDGYDVARVAQIFGGGGHKVAAGCRTRGTLEEIMDKVLAAMKEMIADCNK